MTPRHDDEVPPGILDAYRRGRILDDRRSGDDDRRDDGAFKVKWSVVVQIIGWAVSLFVLYNAMTSRLTALETNRTNDTQRMERNEQRLERIEGKLDRALEKK